MKLLWTFCCLWALMLLSGCEPQPIPSYTPQITGSIVSREAIVETPLTNGSQALFNATGGTTISNQVFTLNNGVWQDETGKEVSINPDSETTLTAIYPAYSGKTLVIDNPYHDGTLQDVLIAQNTFSGTTDIQLKFHHLFSQLNVHVHSSKASSIKAVELTAPKVTKIDPLNVTFTCQDTFATQKPKDDSNVYSFIVPSIVDCPLTLTFIQDAEEEVIHSIVPLTHNFEAGHKYECHVNRPGIRNAKDLIEFSKFINKPDKEEEEFHTKFGEQIGEEVVYRLLDDIVLTEEDCRQLQPIGMNSAFEYTFDGEGHTISNYILPDATDTGLFGTIGANGIVKRLNVTNAKFASSPTISKNVGVIATYNEGTITECSVTDSNIAAIKGGFPGLICSITYGKIINCYTKNNTITSNDQSYAGGIACSGYGYIMNCYTQENTYITIGASYGGGIMGTHGTKRTYIRNCYVYHNQKTIGNWGAAIGVLQNDATINSFYYDQGSLYKKKASKNIKDPSTDSNVGKYDSDFLFEGTHICDLLNQWIGEKEGYTHWKTDATLPAVFDK